MSMPNCPKCGGASQNPTATQCVYCGQALAAPPPQQAYGAPGGQGAYGPPAPFGAPPQGGYGPPPQHGYGAAPPGAYGGPVPPQQGYGAPHVQPFGGGMTFTSGHQPGGFMSTIGSIGNAIFWIRVAIALFVFSIVGVASCLNAVSQ